MGLAERGDDLVLNLRGEHRLETVLGDVFLAADLPHRRVGAFERPERSHAVGVPAAAVVGSQPSGTGRKQRLAHHRERVGWEIDDELSIHPWPTSVEGKVPMTRA